MKRLLTVLCIVCMVFSLTGCGGGNSPSSDPTPSSGDQQETLNEVLMVGTMPTQVGDAELVFIFSEDGTYEGSASLGQYGTSNFAKGTFTKDGNSLILTDDNGSTYTTTIEGSEVVLTGEWDVGKSSSIIQEITVKALVSEVQAFVRK